MRVGLLTGFGGMRTGSVLSGPIFSRPVACADLVNFPQGIERKGTKVWSKMLSILVPSAQKGLGSNRFQTPSKVRTEPPKTLVGLVFLFNER